jgi:hypothetical protein
MTTTGDLIQLNARVRDKMLEIARHAEDTVARIANYTGPGKSLARNADVSQLADLVSLLAQAMATNYELSIDALKTLQELNQLATQQLDETPGFTPN